MEKTLIINSTRIKRIVISVVSIISIFILLSLILPFLVRPDTLQNLLSKVFRENTGFDITLERPQISLLPLPTFQFHNIQLRDPKQLQTEPFLKIEEFQCRLRFLPLLIKRIELSKVVFKNADVKWPVVVNPDEPARMVEAKNVSAILTNVRSNDWMKVELSGNWLSGETNLSLQGKIKVDFEHPDPAGMSWSGQIKLKTTPLSRLFKELGIPAADFVDSGTVEWNGKLEKEAVSPQFSFQGLLQLNDLIYRVSDNKSKASDKASYKLDLNAIYDLNNQSLTLKPTTIFSPFVNLKATGKINFKEGKAEEIHLAADPVMWDSLPSYVLPMAKMMPVNLGFSGESKIDVVISGHWKELSINANGDLTNALFSYSQYFEKPKSVPFLIQTDHLVFKEGNLLIGEVDVTLNQAKLKGSFVKFNTDTGTGEVTLITNQFLLTGWEKLIPALSNYELSGALKVLVNVKNKQKESSESSLQPKLMYHIAFDQVGIREKSGNPLIQNLNGSIDAGPMDLEAKKFSFQIGDSQISAEAVMFFQEVPRMVANVNSPELDLRSVIAQAVPIAQMFRITLTLEQLVPLQRSIESVIRPDAKLENFSAELNYENKHVILKNLSFGLYDGQCRATGQLDLNSEKPLYGLDAEIEKISLAKASMKDSPSPIEGNLFLVAHVEGEGFSENDIQAKLKGEGTMSLTNGEFKTFDVLGSMAIVAQLAGLGDLVSGSTRFQDINGKFKIGGGKINTDHILLYSDDLMVDAAGDLDFQSNLNFRLQASLSNRVSRKINPSVGEEERIGPIPLILTGTLSKPTLRPDPVLIQDVIVNLVKQKFQKLFPSQDSAKETTETSGSEATQPTETNPLATLMQKDRDSKKTSSERAVQTGMALLESLLKKSE